jgi:small GTP-binding protein
LNDAIRDALRVDATALATVASRLGLASVATRIESSTRARLDDDVLRVAVVGEIKHGKSSLINALVGEAVLPVGVTPTTGVAVVVKTSGPSGPAVVSASGRRTVVDRDRFDELVRGRAEATGRLEVGVPPIKGLPGVEILDTPGINDLDTVKTAVSRGELPTADILVVVLDSTQLLNRTELGFLREAVAAVGGLGASGAHLLVVVNRIDLVPETERHLLVTHLKEFLPDTVDHERGLFMTDARRALKEPGSDAPGVQAVARLRSRLQELAATRPAMLPARTRATLVRDARLLAHHAAISARALTLDEEAVAAEIVQVRRALVDQQGDLDAVRALLSAGQQRILSAVHTRTEAFREELELNSLAIVQVASLKVLSTHLPGSIHDACVAFVERETETLRASLEDLTRKALHTHGERARQRLAHATLRLGFRGPTVFIDPPSLALEASAVAIGVAGTAVMYFGNLMTGMVMTIAGPLATVIIREQSVRRARDGARDVLPAAITRAAEAINEGIEQVVKQHVAAVREHVELADAAIGDQLVAVLERARQQLAGEEPARQLAREGVVAATHELEATTQRLESLEIDVHG